MQGEQAGLMVQMEHLVELDTCLAGEEEEERQLLARVEREEEAEIPVHRLPAAAEEEGEILLGVEVPVVMGEIQ